MEKPPTGYHINHRSSCLTELVVQNNRQELCLFYQRFIPLPHCSVSSPNPTVTMSYGLSQDVDHQCIGGRRVLNCQMCAGHPPR